MTTIFTRAPEHDRRIARGDDFAGDAWRGPEGDLFYVTVGHTPADERTEAERAYDLSRISPLPAARLADYAASPESRALYETMSPESQRLADRLVAILDDLPDDEADRAADLVLATLDELAQPAIEVGYLYHDLTQRGDLTDQPLGPLAWIDYACGEGDARVVVSFDPDGKERPDVILFGRDGVDLDLAMRAFENLRTLLADPRVPPEVERWREKR